MHITPTLVYWITRLDNIQALGTFMAVPGIILAGLFTAPIIDPDIGDECKQIFRRAQKLAAWIGIIGIAIMVFVPSHKEMAAVLVIPRIANSETVAEIGDGVKTLAVEWLQELRPDKKEEGK